MVSPRLAKQHPEEMTIVLQHQFWNLGVDDGGFQVTLRFGGNPERLAVPWAALRSFADPSVGFGLRLRRPPNRAAEPAAAEPKAGPPPPVAEALLPAANRPRRPPAEGAGLRGPQAAGRRKA